MSKQSIGSQLFAVKLAISSALIVGLGFALIISHLQYKHFNYEFWNQLLIVAGPSSVIFFLILFLALLLHYRCPSCRKLWVYNKVESSLLEENIIKKCLLGKKLVSRKYLSEYRCLACQYSKLSNNISIMFQ